MRNNRTNVEPEKNVKPPALWGGVECTVNRLGNQYRDQLVDSGHADRDEDIERIATLGLSALRYPVLWERVMRDAVDADHWSAADWTWSDRRLAKLQACNIEPIIGLLHHGSGPRHTDLLDEGFVSGLRQYATHVARRYPWAEMYTPVNEPLTTARFSCLYGHWYPHARSDEEFATALVTQCMATAEAMRGIRQVTPSAKLLVTEDLGKTHSTLPLQEQADFENDRRWLSIDLLMGKVTRSHPLYPYLARSHRLIRALDQLVAHPMPPDLLGFNYYLTSERFLDHSYESYPAWSHGGNSRCRYADVDAIRVLQDGIDGREKLLEEAWNRYRLPMAVTEVHLCGPAEEQIVWLRDCWNGALDLRSRGIDVRAVTVWSLFGSCDWNTLCTERTGHYEPGAFDVRSGAPEPTPLADFIRALPRATHAPIMDCHGRGWWQENSRLIYAMPGVRSSEEGWQPNLRSDEKDICATFSLSAGEIG